MGRARLTRGNHSRAGAATPTVSGVTGEQRWETYDPGEGRPASESPPPTTGRTGGGGLAALLVAGVVVAGVGAGIVALVAGSDDGDDTTAAVGDDVPQPEQEAQPPDVLSPAGYADLVAAVREQTGSARVFEATLYPAYAVVDLPEDAKTQRERSFYWDGELDDTGTGKADGKRIDLAAIDPAALLRLSRKVRALVDEPSSYYVIIEGPSTVFPDDGTRIRAYANNEYSEGAYISADARGKVIRTVEW